MKLTTLIEIKDFTPLIRAMEKAVMVLKTPEDITDFFFCLHMAGLALLDHPEQLPDLDFQSTMRAMVKDFRKRVKGRMPHNVDFLGQELFTRAKD